MADVYQSISKSGLKISGRLIVDMQKANVEIADFLENGGEESTWENAFGVNSLIHRKALIKIHTQFVSVHFHSCETVCLRPLAAGRQLCQLHQKRKVLQLLLPPVNLTHLLFHDRSFVGL